MKTIIGILLVTCAAQAARIKDIANVRGVRDNQLVGYGLVVGLAGTGDGKAEFTSKSLARMLDTIGMKLTADQIESKNVAAVVITTNLPPFARAGNKVDITVNSIGGASSLAGGTLIQTPLRAADSQVYAVAQGGVLTEVGEKGRKHMTSGYIPGGAIVEADLGSDFSNRKMFRLTLSKPDFTTASRLVKTLNQELGGKFASATDSGSVDVIVPVNYEGNAVEFLAAIENFDVESDSKARVLINEKTGTVVIGENVRIDTVAISHGGITVEVASQKAARPAQGAPPVQGTEGPEIRGPASVGGGGKKDSPQGGVAVLKKSTSVGDLVRGLNALGAKPKDLIIILQSIKAAGALQGELEIL